MTVSFILEEHNYILAQHYKFYNSM